MTVRASRRTPPLVLAVSLLLFLASTLGAWAWFHVKPAVPESNLEFTARTNLTGTRYTADPISAQQMEILANTNVINGHFLETGTGRRFSVFFADWRAQSAREMNVVQHTPDICWVGAGFTAVALGQPAKVALNFGGIELPFECRAFRAPRGGHQEMTLWCTLVSGQLFEEGGRFAAEEDAQADRRVRQASANRRRGFEQFLRVVRERIPGDGSKQFVRFSTPVAGDPQGAVEALKRFGEKWLELQRSTPQTAAR